MRENKEFGKLKKYYKNEKLLFIFIFFLYTKNVYLIVKYNYMNLQNKKGFTLVELIVVITILAILSTIWFVSYSWYLAWTRDSNRISQLKAISEWLQLYSTNHSLPTPDAKSTKVMDWSTQIATQWYAWKKVLETITYSTEWLDPKDNIYYSYYLTKNKKYYQLMGWLEEEDNLQNQATWVDYSIRFPIVFWNKLWILTTADNEPIQESLTTIDISNLWTTEIKSYLKDSEYVTGTWSRFSNLDEVDEKWGQYWSVKNNLFVYFNPNDINYWVKMVWNNNRIESVTQDTNWNIYITWTFTDTANIFWEVITSNGGRDLYLAKLDSSWNVLWLKKTWWIENEDVRDLKIDNNWNIYIVWKFENTADIFWETLTSNGGWDWYLAKLDSFWNILWSKQMWWSGYDRMRNIILDPNWDIYITWGFYDTADIYWQNFISSGYSDWFITKLDNSWNVLWSKQMWWAGDDGIFSIRLDTNWNIYISWYISDTSDVFWQSYTSSGDYDWIIAKLDDSWNALWSKQMWWSGYDGVFSISLDINWSIYVASGFSNTADIFWQNFTSAWGRDSTITKLDSSWTALWSKQMWWVGAYDDIYDLKLDANWNIYITWIFSDTADIFWQSFTSAGSYDWIIVKLNNSWTALWSKQIWWSGSDSLGNMELDWNSDILFSWNITWTVDVFWEEISGGWGTNIIWKLSKDWTLD